MLIGRNPGISQTALSRANGRDKSTLTPVLNDLVSAASSAAVGRKDDHRVYELSLTTAGRRLLAELTARAVHHERNLDRIIGRRDRERFLSVLRRIEAELAVERANGKPSARG